MFRNKKIQKSKVFELPMNRNAQGLSINVVIIAAIALLVLVILSVLLLRAGSELVVDCSDINGVCEESCSDIGELYAKYSNAVCLDETEVCCVAIKK